MRIRLRWRKTGRVRFISHLDDVRVWERAVRRAGLPLVFTEGFAPRPRMQFGPALPTCFESSAEYIDLELRPDGTDVADLPAIVASISAVLPEGEEVLCAAVVADKGPALQAVVTAAEYVVPLLGARRAQLAGELEGVLAAQALPLTIDKKGKRVDVDVRPGLLDAAVIDAGAPLPAGAHVAPANRAVFEDSVRLWLRVAIQPRSVRPAEVLAVMRTDAAEHLSHRSAQLIPGPAGTWAEPLAQGHDLSDSAPVATGALSGTVVSDGAANLPGAVPGPDRKTPYDGALC